MLDNIINFSNSILIPIVIFCRNRHRRKVFRLITNENFDIFMQVIILLNIIPIGFDLAHDDTWDNADEWLLALEV